MLRDWLLKVLIFAETGPPLSQNGDVLHADALTAQNGGLSASQIKRRKKLEARLARQALVGGGKC